MADIDNQLEWIWYHLKSVMLFNWTLISQKIISSNMDTMMSLNDMETILLTSDSRMFVLNHEQIYRTVFEQFEEYESRHLSPPPREYTDMVRDLYSPGSNTILQNLPVLGKGVATIEIVCKVWLHFRKKNI